MADNVENLILEQLRAIRADSGGIRDKGTGQRARLVAWMELSEIQVPAATR